MKVKSEEFSYAIDSARSGYYVMDWDSWQVGSVETPQGIVKVDLGEPDQWYPKGITVYRFAFDGRLYYLREETTRTKRGAAIIAHRWVKELIGHD